MEPVTAYLGLGSNLGRRDKNLVEAISGLRGDWVPAGARDRSVRQSRGRTGVELLRASSVYETDPWGYACQPSFLNCALKIRTTLPPSQLLESVKGLEAAMGRLPGFRNGPRLIDVDILLYGDSTVDLPGLQIPHPRLHQRAFVLVPLAELAQGVVHPVLRTTIANLAAQAGGREGVRLWGPPFSVLAQTV